MYKKFEQTKTYIDPAEIIRHTHSFKKFKLSGIHG